MAKNDFHGAPSAHPHRHSLGSDVRTTLSSIYTLAQKKLRPLPTQTGDGTYVAEHAHSGFLKDISKLGLKDVITIKDAIKGHVATEPINDKTYFMERIIKIAAELPIDSRAGQDLTNGFLKILWNDLQHPPLSYLDERYKYRQADGSYNNIRWPQIGAAKTPYARTVRPMTPLPSALPDPGVLFDSLMVRKTFRPHPAKISSMLFYLATVIIHDIFRTDRHDPSISLTSSYLDLAPLYGSNQDEQNEMRTHKDGKLKPDCFSEKRIIGQPMGVGILLIMFNRFHNDIATKLPMINEGGRFTKPADTDKHGLKKYDNDIFQTARLITCGLYINCILKDYVRVILNLNRTNSVWDLDPRSEEGKTLFGTPTEEGVGNQCSAEFNLVYRWHSAISERDDRWAQEAMKETLNGQDPSELTIPELMRGLGAWEAKLPLDPHERPFGKLKRQSDGTFPDDDLVPILKSSIEDVAGAFGANHVPKMLRSVEILGIIQARNWNVATLNEFRAYFNLKKYETFEEINDDEEVANQLRHLYEHPDLVELYPGLVVEQAKELRDSSGLCPSFTVSRAVLSDAVALVRGDRFYTVDYTPRNLTTWGFEEASSNTAVDQGHVFYKLILRAFPHHFKHNSVYAHFPLTIPSENKVIMHRPELDYMDQYYNFDEPAFIPPPTPISSYDAGTKILDNQAKYKVAWGEPIEFLMESDGTPYGKDFMLSGDGQPNAESREVMHHALFKDNWHNEVKKFYEKITHDLLREKSYTIGGVKTVDIVRDVGNLAQVHFAAEVFSLPLKTHEHPFDGYSEYEMYQVMALVFSCIFFDADIQKSFPLRQIARAVTQQLGEYVIARITPLRPGIVRSVFERFHSHSPLPEYGIHMIEKLLDKGYGASELVWTHLLPTAGGMVANQGQLFAQCLDYYLSDEGKPHFEEIKRLAKLDTTEADELILRYFMEGARIRSSVGLYRDVQEATTIQDGDKTVHLKAGERVMVNLVSASHDPKAFPDPEKVNLKRDMDSYVHYGWGPHACLGLEASKLALTTMLKTVAKLPNLRRVPGPQGQIHTIKVQGYSVYMTEDGKTMFPFPPSMKVNWDDATPDPNADDIHAKEYPSRPNGVATTPSALWKRKWGDVE